MALARPIFVFFLFAALCCANSIIVNSVDTPLGLQNTLYINENGSNTQLFWVGGINATIDGHARVVWCAQLFVDINLNTTYNSTVDFADTAQLQRVGWMMKNLVQGVTTQLQGAAFQLAIWDIIEDNGDGFNAGAGKVYKSTSTQHPTDTTVLALAAQYEAQSLGKLYEWVPVYHNVTVKGGTPVQELIGPIVNDGGPLSEAPEPRDAGMMLGGLSLIGLAWRRRRRRT